MEGQIELNFPPENSEENSIKAGKSKIKRKKRVNSNRPFKGNVEASLEAVKASREDIDDMYRR